MKVSGDFTFDAPQSEVWEALLDPEVLASVLPGCEKLDLVGENQYEGALKIKVGPVQGKFQGKIGLSDIVPPEGYAMTVDGRGAPGFVKAKAKVSLAPTAGGAKTVMTYDSDAQVGGRIATVGQRLLDSSAKAIIKQSLEGLDKVLAARSGAASPDPITGKPKPAPEIETPTQAEFAANVAREVAKDLLPKPVLIGIAAVVVLVLALVFSSREEY